MKFAKLILIFIILAGGLALALMWENLFPPASKADSNSREYKEKIENERSEIVKDWSRQNEWNKQLHERNHNHIEQLKKSGNISNDAYIILRNSLIENSTNKAYDDYMKAIKSKDHKSDKVNKAFQAIVYLRDNEGLKEDTRVKEVENRNRLFNQIYNFVGRSHPIRPSFNSSTMSWTSFQAQQNAILNEAASYRSNKYYNDIKHWPNYESGLSETTLKKETDSQKDAFYRNLTFQIISYFDQNDENEANAARLKTLHNKFSGEAGENYSRELTKYRRDYEKQLKENSSH